MLIILKMYFAEQTLHYNQNIFFCIFSKDSMQYFNKPDLITSKNKSKISIYFQFIAIKFNKSGML